MTNLDRFRQLIERGFVNGDLTIADEIAAEQFTEHQYLVPRGLSGPETLRMDIAAVREELPGFEFSIEDAVEVGDKVWSRITCRGIHPVTGTEVSMSVMDVCRFEDGLMVEHWGIPDRFALLHQLGLLPD